MADLKYHILVVLVVLIWEVFCLCMYATFAQWNHELQDPDSYEKFFFVADVIGALVSGINIILVIATVIRFNRQNRVDAKDFIMRRWNVWAMLFATAWSLIQLGVDIVLVGGGHEDNRTGPEDIIADIALFCAALTNTLVYTYSALSLHDADLNTFCLQCC